jgi:hypothetical protein
MGYFFNPFTGNFDYSIDAATAASASQRTNVTPTPTPDGTTTTFTLPESYLSGSLWVSQNGLVAYDVTELSATTFSFSVAPFVGENIRATYDYGAVAPTGNTYGSAVYGTGTYS